MKGRDCCGQSCGDGLAVLVRYGGGRCKRSGEPLAPDGGGRTLVGSHRSPLSAEFSAWD